VRTGGFRVLADNGLTQNLNDIVATVLANQWPDWRLIDVADINNFGEIVGLAEYRAIIGGVVVQNPASFVTFRLGAKAHPCSTFMNTLLCGIG